MTFSQQLSITADELPALRAAMRDAQTAAADYYGRTARNDSIEDLGTPVRRFLVAAQTVNDLLTNSVSDAATYAGVVGPAGHPNAGVIRAVKYVRNVAQHVAHVIRPKDDHELVGGVLGLRIYTFWDEVPAAVDAQLHQSTQRLKVDYDAYLLDKELAETMLTTLGFFSDIAPDIVHRDERGEWTGFPLMSQPSVGGRLHPEEPVDETVARTWLDGRSPNGDVRVICCQLTEDGTRYVLGHTFVGRLSFARFVESVEQLRKDTAGGYPYVVGDVHANTSDRTAYIPHVVQEPVLGSDDDIAAWTTPAPTEGWEDDWVDPKAADDWHRVLRFEQGTGLLGSTSYQIRRARRLNALLPYSP